tara:strand:+ start:2270 stop:3694 length:1425 start_codon:yes stop_codon:yes gene_type:complete
MSDTNLIIDQTKNHSGNFGHIFRSSAIFYIPKNIKTTISVSNYWDFKNKKKVSLLFSLRNKKGKIVSREEKKFAENKVINAIYEFSSDHSVEIEAFGNENLRIPYAAVMACYEARNSICMLHSYSRNHSLIELEDNHCHTIAKESCWSIKPEFINKAIFHNGHLEVGSQTGELILTNLDGNEKKVKFKIPSIKSYETIVFNIETLCKNYKSFLKNKPGFATINFKNSSSFTRLMLIWEDKGKKEFQATHSNFDYSSFKTNNIKSEQGGEMTIPKGLDNLNWFNFVVYPKFQKGTYSVLHENKKIDFKTGLIKQINDDSKNLFFFKKNSAEIPSRIVTGIQGATRGQIVPFECSTGVAHEKTPSIRFRWAMVSGKFESYIYVSRFNIKRKNSNKVGDTFIFKLYSSKSEKILEKAIKYNASSEGKYVFNLGEIFEDYKEFLGYDFGYISLFDESRNHHMFTSMKKNNSITFEHSF